MRLKIYTSPKETIRPQFFDFWIQWLVNKKSAEVRYEVVDVEIDKIPPPVFIEGNSKNKWRTQNEVLELENLKKDFEKFLKTKAFKD